jgi:16S rRNA (guanine527-N7)-methyltransferase
VSDQRVEDLGLSNRRATFDVATARAVALLPWLIEWAVPLLKKGGVLLAMKGERANDEIALSARAYKRLNASEPAVEPIELPGTERHVIVRVTKLGATHESYPRPPSLAKGKHL